MFSRNAQDALGVVRFAAGGIERDADAAQRAFDGAEKALLQAAGPMHFVVRVRSVKVIRLDA